MNNVEFGFVIFMAFVIAGIIFLSFYSLVEEHVCPKKCLDVLNISKVEGHYSFIFKDLTCKCDLKGNEIKLFGK